MFTFTYYLTVNIRTTKILAFSTNCVLASIIKSLNALFTRTSVSWNRNHEILLSHSLTETCLCIPGMEKKIIACYFQFQIVMVFCTSTKMMRKITVDPQNQILWISIWIVTLASWTSELTCPWISWVLDIILWEKSCRYRSIWKYSSWTICATYFTVLHCPTCRYQWNFLFVSNLTVKSAGKFYLFGFVKRKWESYDVVGNKILSEWKSSICQAAAKCEGLELLEIITPASQARDQSFAAPRISSTLHTRSHGSSLLPSSKPFIYDKYQTKSNWLIQKFCKI